MLRVKEHCQYQYLNRCNLPYLPNLPEKIIKTTTFIAKHRLKCHISFLTSPPTLLPPPLAPSVHPHRSHVDFHDPPRALYHLSSPPLSTTWLLYVVPTRASHHCSSQPSQSASPNASATSCTSFASDPPDVLLNVPNLSVGRIELAVENLQADINLNANIASLVSINAGVALSVQNINLTIVDVQAELDLVVRLGNLVAIVNRVFKSLDLNPGLITSLTNVTGLLDPVVGAVDGELGSITQGGNTLTFTVDKSSNIVQQVTGGQRQPSQHHCGQLPDQHDHTGESQSLQNGLVQKTYSYSPLSALVNIVFVGLRCSIRPSPNCGPVCG